MADSKLEYSMLPDDDPHYTVIGLVACLWGFLESGIDGAISDLARTDERVMACVTAQLIGPARRMDALVALFRHEGGSEEIVKQLKKFQGSIQQLGEDRNRVVHDPLMKNNKTGKVHKSLTTAKGELKYELAPVSIDDMKKTAEEIREANWRFSHLRDAIKAEMNRILEEQLQRSGVIPLDQNPLTGGS